MRGCEDGGAADAAGGGDPGGAPGPVRQLHEPGAGGRVLRDQLHPGAPGPGRARPHGRARADAPLAGPAAAGGQRRLLQPRLGGESCFTSSVSYPGVTRRLNV